MGKGMSKGSDSELLTDEEELTSGGANSEFYTPTTSFREDSAMKSRRSSSSSAYQSPRIDSLRASRSAYKSAVEFEIAASKSHWTQVDSDEEPACSPEDNLEYFQSLMLNFRWGRGRGWPHRAYFEKPNVLVGNKIAEGGQAEIYEATLDGGDPVPLVVKVFKEGYSVRSLARQWPPGMIKLWKRHEGNERALLPSPFFLLKGAVLLNNERFHNRFAFVMRRAWGDLRKHIDERMLNRPHKQAGPPYSTEETLILIWAIAQDMFWLHEQGILHRDLKASNVLVWVENTSSEVGRFEGKVSDFECSVGVLGTGFWRAPEILQQLKDEVSMSKVVFTTKADVYSFGMTCYEIVTGCTPFEDLLWQDYDHVVNGNQPTLPEDLDPLIKKMICSCWQLDPVKRPTFRQILDEIYNLNKKIRSRSLIRKTRSLNKQELGTFFKDHPWRLSKSNKW